MSDFEYLIFEKIAHAKSAMGEMPLGRSVGLFIFHAEQKAILSRVICSRPIFGLPL